MLKYILKNKSVNPICFHLCDMSDLFGWLWHIPLFRSYVRKKARVFLNSTLYGTIIESRDRSNLLFSNKYLFYYNGVIMFWVRKDFVNWILTGKLPKTELLFQRLKVYFYRKVFEDFRCKDYAAVFCHASPLFKEWWNKRDVRNLIEEEARLFEKDCDTNDFVIGKENALFYAEVLSDKKYRDVRFRFLNYVLFNPNI